MNEYHVEGFNAEDQARHTMMCKGLSERGWQIAQCLHDAALMHWPDKVGGKPAPLYIAQAYRLTVEAPGLGIVLANFLRRGDDGSVTP